MRRMSVEVQYDNKKASTKPLTGCLSHVQFHLANYRVVLFQLSLRLFIVIIIRYTSEKTRQYDDNTISLSGVVHMV